MQKKAKANGFEVNVYLEKLVEKDVDRAKTIDETLAPFRLEVEESGIRTSDWTLWSKKPEKKFTKIN
ncbi:MAG: hypothetical protein H0W45_02345 [Acidobacteria bacterium]|nr:hypothetical protein [Acidobacteriota bacterium]